MTKKTPYDFVAKKYGFSFECTNDPSISVYYVYRGRDASTGYMVQVGNDKVGFAPKFDFHGGRTSTKPGEQHIWEFDDFCKELSAGLPYPHTLTNKYQFDSFEEQQLFVDVLIDAFTCEDKNGFPVEVVFSDKFIAKMKSGECIRRNI